MRKQTYAEIVNEAKLMAHGLIQNQPALAKRGINNEFMTKLTGLHEQAQSLDNEQESLKSRLKQKTEEMEKVLTDLGAQISEARKLVKMDIPQTGWKEFGIQDVR